MSRQRIMQDESHRATGDDAQRRLLAGAPVKERRLDLAGVSTAVLEAGDGPPVVLLHGQGGWAGMWLPVVPELADGHHVVAPARRRRCWWAPRWAARSPSASRSPTRTGCPGWYWWTRAASLASGPRQVLRWP